MTKSSPSDAHRRAPTERVLSARGWVASTLREVLVTCSTGGAQGVSYSALASRLGASKSQVQRWTDVLSGDTVTVADVDSMGATVALAFAKAWLARLEDRGDRGVGLRDLVMDVHAAGGRLAERVREAMADGHVDAKERRLIRAAALELQALAADVLARLEKLEAEERP